MQKTELKSEDNVFNGSFETCSNLPASISLWNIVYDCSVGSGSEFTRCLAIYPLNDFDPIKNLYCGTSPSCNLFATTPPKISRGWFNPTWGTPDYYNQTCSTSVCTPPDRDYNDLPFPDIPKKQLPYGDHNIDMLQTYIGDPYNGGAAQNGFTRILLYRSYWWDDATRKMIVYPANATLSCGDFGLKNEYLSQKLDQPLAAHHCYNIKMRINGVPDNNLSWGAINTNNILDWLSSDQIKCYFSQDPLIQEDSKPIESNSLLAANFNSWDPSLPVQHLERKDFKIWSFPYSSNLQNWIELNGKISNVGDEALNYITIGNFKTQWIDGVDFEEPTNFIKEHSTDCDNVMAIQFFIDAIEITEDPDCHCDCSSETHGIKFWAIEKPKMNINDLCCVDFFVERPSYFACAIVSVSLFEINKVNGVETETYKFKYPSNFGGLQYFPNGEIIKIGTLCYNNGEEGHKEYHLKAWYRTENWENDIYQHCNLFQNIDLTCKVDCSIIDASPSIILEKKLNQNPGNPFTSECCFDLKVKNNSTDQSLDLGNILIQGDFDKINFRTYDDSRKIEYTKFGGVESMVLKAINLLPEGNSSRKNVIAPGEINNDLGTFCIAEGSPAINLHIIILDANNDECSSADLTATCDCCDGIFVDAKPISQIAGLCCFNLYVQQSANSPQSTNCFFNQIKVYDLSFAPDDRLVETINLTENSIALYNSRTYLETYCNLAPNQNTTLKFEFINNQSQPNFTCTKLIPLNCKNCCDNISIETINLACENTNSRCHRCCFGFNAKVLDYECDDIFKIEFWKSISGGTSQLVSIINQPFGITPDANYINNSILVGSSELYVCETLYPPYINSISAQYKFVFKDLNDNIICEKIVDKYCSTGIPAVGPSGYPKEISKDSNNLNSVIYSDRITNIMVIPNPNEGNFTLDFNAQEEGVFDVCIYSEIGDCKLNLIQKKINKGKNSISFKSELTNGAYFLQLKTDVSSYIVPFTIIK
ncbi:MAG: hypothetical protein NT007_04635 [Candidatus Kapabacteria bacterium]|nr:hypothetical protein [Candidatus Kapabacteria bacterium]